MLTSAEEVKITVTMDNYYDGLLLPGVNVQRYRFMGSAGPEPQKLPPHIAAEHGFGCHIEVTAGGRKNSLLMDFGVSENGTANNIKAMRMDLAGVGAAVLSHGHFDHYGGLASVMGLVGGKIPLYLGSEAFSRRYINMPGMRVDLGRLEPEKVEAAGCAIKEISGPEEIMPGVLAIGPVPRITDFEQGSPLLAVERDGQILADHFPGELSLAFNLSGKGLVILTACAHNGIVNITRRAMELTGEHRIHAILGGFHLSGAPAVTIEKTAAALTELAPGQIVPMHCTGFEALKALSDRLAGKFVLYSAGSCYTYN